MNFSKSEFCILAYFIEVFSVEQVVSSGGVGRDGGELNTQHSPPMINETSQFKLKLQ